MHILFATAELTPIASVGGLAQAAAGLVKQLRADGLDVTIVMPDYGDIVLEDQTVAELETFDWLDYATARTGTHPVVGEVTLIDVPGMAKPHPYNNVDGDAFEDNDRRFFGFSAAVASLARRLRPDVVHVNDWHTGATLGYLNHEFPSILTIHTLAYQGISHSFWLETFPSHTHDYAWYGGTNPLFGALRLADRVVTVSPNYANEILHEVHGMGLHEHLAAKAHRLVGIINGIDVETWDPTNDEYLPATYSAADLADKAKSRKALMTRVGLDPANPSPIYGMVTRLVHQKGLDLVVDTAQYLANVPAQLVILGSGDSAIAESLEIVQSRFPDRVAFLNGFDIEVSHLVFAGSDLLLMPSIFEPCGLAQMQAMRYGTIPVVTPVGGLVDTVIDLNADPENGTGVVALEASAAGIVDAIYRSNRVWTAPSRREAAQQRGMAHDWSWAGPAQQYQDLYKDVINEHR